MAQGVLLSPLVKNPRELLAAGFGGAVGTGLDVGCLVLLVKHGVSVPVATFLAALAGAAELPEAPAPDGTAVFMLDGDDA